MRWQFFIKIIFFLFLLACIPAGLIIYMIMTGFSFYGVLAVVAYLQFLLLWLQAEIGLKQHVLFASQFDAFFKLDWGTSINNKGVLVTITNVSNNPAYRMAIGRFLAFQKIPIDPKFWENIFSMRNSSGALSFAVDIAPKESATLVISNKDGTDFIIGKTIEMYYQNKFGEIKSLLISFRGASAYIDQHPMNEPGILLNVFQDIRLFFSALKYEWYFREHQRNK